MRTRLRMPVLHFLFSGNRTTFWNGWFLVDEIGMIMNIMYCPPGNEHIPLLNVLLSRWCFFPFRWHMWSKLGWGGAKKNMLWWFTKKQSTSSLNLYFVKLDKFVIDEFAAQFSRCFFFVRQNVSKGCFKQNESSLIWIVSNYWVLSGGYYCLCFGNYMNHLFLDMHTLGIIFRFLV